MTDTVTVEVLFDNEIYTGQWATTGKKFHAPGDIIELPADRAEKLIEERRVRSVVKPKAAPAAEPKKSEIRLELEARAEELGIKFKHNISDTRLSERVAEAEAALDG